MSQVYHQCAVELHHCISWGSTSTRRSRREARAVQQSFAPTSLTLTLPQRERELALHPLGRRQAHEVEDLGEGEARGERQLKTGSGQGWVHRRIRPRQDAVLLIEVVEGGGELEGVVGQVVRLEVVRDALDELRQLEHLAQEDKLGLLG